MDNRLYQGDMLSDYAGDAQTITGLTEQIQVALLRLTMRKGSFPYQPNLGSELYRLDSHKLDDQTIRFVVEDALRDMTSVVVLDIERDFDADQGILTLVVYMRIDGQDAIAEWQETLS